MDRPEVATEPTTEALLSPLPIDADNWRSRWLVAQRWNALHRIAEIVWEDGEMIVGEGVTVCGRRARFSMPGIFSRMGLKRCPQCCKALGIPAGNGAPFNALTGEEADA